MCRDLLYVHTVVPFITVVLKVTKLDLQTVITDPGTLAALQVSSSKLDANIKLGAATALGGNDVDSYTFWYIFV